MTVREFFAGWPSSYRLFRAVRAAVRGIGRADIRVTKSQIAFARRRAFAWAWIPSRYLRGAAAPLVLSVVLRRKDQSSRWKEIVEPVKARYMHHLELREETEIDDQVQAWLREAWEHAA